MDNTVDPHLLVRTNNVDVEHNEPEVPANVAILWQAMGNASGIPA